MRNLTTSQVALLGVPPPKPNVRTRPRAAKQSRSRPSRSAGFNFQHIDQRITLVTLGVADYARAKAFYAALGWRPAREVEETAFFQGNGIILALWGREKLGPDLGIPDDGAHWSGISLAQNVRSQEEVHAVIELARKNSAEITREPADTFYGGYAGAFRDLDGHAWEIAHNPGFGLDDNGNVILPRA
jgi:predicted lactoylglutathione lyase